MNSLVYAVPPTCNQPPPRLTSSDLLSSESTFGLNVAFLTDIRSINTYLLWGTTKPVVLLQPRDQGLLNRARARAAGLLNLAEQREEARHINLHSSSSSNASTDEELFEGDDRQDEEMDDSDDEGVIHADNIRDNLGLGLPDSESSDTEGSDTEGSVMNSSLASSGSRNSGSSVGSHSEDSGDEHFDEADMDVALLESLRAWARRGVSKSKVTELLSILRLRHPFLPKTCRGLLKTPSQLPITDVGGGLYFYKGILKNIQSRLDQEYLARHNEIIVDINMDGIPPFRNSPANFFPILGCFGGQQEPFIIAGWFGHRKEPDDLNEFLNDYIQEVELLQNEGVQLFGNVYPFRIRNYILDALARAFVKCWIGHGGTYGCEKCVVEGVRFRNRTTFTGLNCPLRTDESFRNRDQPLHHKPGLVSPLERINTGMISQFRLDPLHLLYLGVFRRWLDFILIEPGNFVLTDDQVGAVSAAVLNLKEFCPCEFNRKPREFKRRGNHFKAHELRRILLYDGLSAFSGLDANLYRNYLLLHSASYILTSPHLRDFLEVANECVRNFINHCRQIFTRAFLVYNVHSLSHIVQEAENHGTLEEFSAFKFENYLGVMKRSLRSGYLPLHQVYNKDAETDGKLTNPTQQIDPNAYILSREHNRPAGEIVDGTQFQMLKTGNITLSLSRPDCCFLTQESEVCILSNIVQTLEGEIFLIGRKFSVKESAYLFPLDSALLDIFRFSVVKFLSKTLSDQETVSVISSLWLQPGEKYCFWPPKSKDQKKNPTQQAIDHCKPDPETWHTYPIMFMHDYASFYKASLASKQAEDTDTLSTEQSDYNKPRKGRGRLPARFVSDEESPPSKRLKKSRGTGKPRKQTLSSDEEPDEVPPPPSIPQLESTVNKILRRQVEKSEGKSSGGVQQKKALSVKVVVPATNKKQSSTVAIPKVIQAGNNHQESNIKVKPSKALPVKQKVVVPPPNKKPGSTVVVTKVIQARNNHQESNGQTQPRDASPVVSTPNEQSSTVAVPGEIQAGNKHQESLKSIGSFVVITADLPAYSHSGNQFVRENADVGTSPEATQISGISHQENSNFGSQSDLESLGQDNESDGVYNISLSPQRTSEHDLEMDHNTLNDHSLASLTNPRQDNFETIAKDQPSTSSFGGPFVISKPKCHSSPSPVNDNVCSSSAQLIVERLEFLNSRVNTVLSNQRRILSYVIPEDEQDVADFDDSDFDLKFPLKTIDEFSDFESYIALRSNKRAFVSFFKYIISSVDSDKFKASSADD
ncbi:hypothetical protein FOCC_FOCC008350 [Frankliniella occidentalis]|nr:hypothetical protein FOCC_FOCC008350 [Frankliniella occidentalis]